MTLKAYYKFERGDEDILHMYTPQKMEPWRVAIEECEHLECRRFKEERKELPEHLKNLSEKERVLLAINETADVMVEEFRNGQHVDQEEDGDMPKVNMESFTKIMSIPSKYGLIPLQIEEYKLKADPDVKQAFAHLEERMKDAGASQANEDDILDREPEKIFHMSPESRERAQPNSDSLITESLATFKEDERKVTVDIKPSTEPVVGKSEFTEEKSRKKKKKNKQKQQGDDSSWFTYAAVAGAIAAAAVLLYVAVRPRSAK